MEGEKTPATPSKGKQKMEEGEEEEEEPPSAAGDFHPPPSPAAEEDPTCGICLSDGYGRSIRGSIDSCDHFFCFICIMEWAKIETRCPMCKQRFRSIRRSAINSLFQCERVVKVPVRDQASLPLDNGSTAPYDPYADTICSQCHTAANDELLLLCDLCDSASHTYCVGLGHTVPEGDWYCCDCKKIKDELPMSHSDSVGVNQDSYNSLRAQRSSQPPVSIFEIVSDGFVSDSSLEISTSQVFEQQRNDDRPAARRNTTDRSESRGPLPVSETKSSTQAEVVEQVARRTLRHCRTLQDRIRTLRANWNYLRSGSLAFSSSVLDCTNKGRAKKRKCMRRNSETARPSEPISSVCIEPTTHGTASSKMHISTESKDVNKAWKMMEIAKSVKGAQMGTVPNWSLNLTRKRNIANEVENHNRSSFYSKGHVSPHKLSVYRPVDDRRNSLPTGLPKVMSPHKRNIAYEVENHNHSTFISKGHVSPQKSSAYRPVEDCGNSLPIGLSKKKKSPDKRKQESDVQKMKEIQHFHSRSSRIVSLYGESSSDGQDRLVQEDLHDGKRGSAPQQVLEKLLIAVDDQNQCFPPFSVSGASSTSTATPVESSCFKVEPCNRKQVVSTNAGGSLKINGNGSSKAKGEVQSLVKLNLKLLSKDQQLGAYRFKEVARVATHTILMACGLEHSKSNARPFSSPVCRHSEYIREFRKSNLMPNSCRECFFSFVQNVVNSVMSDKTFSLNSI